jgi:ribosome biogenesis GTPase
MENQKARVISEYKGAYKVKKVPLFGGQEFLAKVTGKQMFTAKSREDYPAVGDWVLIDELPENQAVIKNILPRRSIIKRKYGDKNKVGEKSNTQIIAVNIDVAFVVQSLGRDYNLNRFERYFSILSDGSIKPTIILNKIDLVSKQELDEVLAQIKNRFPNIDVILTSTITDKAINQLKNYLQADKTYCFLGSSGVGKSSIINKLLGKDLIRTEQISSYSDRGKHITTTRQMYFLENGAIVIDNPGIREVGLTDADSTLDSLFDKITELSLQCKFNDCSHNQEAGCKILKAVESGEIDKKQYENYLSLKKESDFYKMSEIEKKEKERDFGKFIKKAKKDLKVYGIKNN